MWPPVLHLTRPEGEMGRRTGGTRTRTTTPQPLMLRVLGSASVERGGELLEGLELCDAFRFQAWCTARREDARKLHAAIQRALVAKLADNPEEALLEARKLVELEPADEGAHRRVMELLARLNRPREAV